MKAVMGKILIVDLTTRALHEQEIHEDVYIEQIGGVGLAVKLLTDMIPAGADPLGPQNVLAFMSGALTGSGSLMTGRWMVCTKSPLTGGWGDANCGGNFSPAIKQCGWDGILFTGAAQVPLIFISDENGPRLELAGELWGHDAIETEVLVLAAWKGKKKPAISCIGPSAEKLSLISGISNDGGRYAARSGVGAVMGSKRLKAVVLSGSKKITCANPEKVRAASKRYAEAVSKTTIPAMVKGRHLPLLGRLFALKTVFPMNGILAAGILKKWGTIYNNTTGLLNGDSPVKNWGGSVNDFKKKNYVKLDPDLIVSREIKKYHCYSCVIGCGGICDTRDMGTAGTHTHKPEYETCCAFGPLLMNDNLESIFLCNDLCNRSGLDTISAGSAIAFAMECYENGILDAKDTQGLELRWGNSDAIVALLRAMIARRGIGDILADGVALASKKIGRGSERFAIHSGGQEPGMHDPRYDPMMGTAYVSDPTPSRHTIAAGVYYNVSRIWDFVSWAPSVKLPYAKAREYEAGEIEARKLLAGSLLKQLLDAVGGCLFALTTGLNNWKLFDWLNDATGLTCSPDEWMEKARNIQLARYAFNKKHGINNSGYKMHPRMSGKEPLTSGPLAGKSVPLDEMAMGYFDALENKL